MSARMYDLATELAHAPQRSLKIVYLKVRQGMRVTWSLAPFMQAERRGVAGSLPARALIA